MVFFPFQSAFRQPTVAVGARAPKGLSLRRGLSLRSSQFVRQLIRQVSCRIALWAGPIALMGCGVGEPLELELPEGTYAVLEDGTPSDVVTGSAESTSTGDTSRGNGTETAAIASDSLAVLSLQTPDIQPFLDWDDTPATRIAPARNTFLCTAESSFCGGDIQGDWEVDVGGNCDSHKEAPGLLWDLAQELVDLRGSVCTSAPRWHSTSWTGALTFHTGVASDSREEHTTLRVVVGPECLTATLGEARTVQTTAENCALLNNEFTTCDPGPGRCVCTSHAYRSGQGSGIYQYLEAEDTVQISNQSERQTISYHYCVEDDERMVWWEPDTGDRLVLRRKGTEQRTLNLPQELPLRPVR